MNFQVVAEHGFDASHVIEGDPACGRLHGHHWRVRAFASVRFDLIKGRAVPLDLSGGLRAVLDELDGEDLNTMMPATHTGDENIAAWVMERLNGAFRTLERVEVWHSEHDGMAVEREVR